MSLFSKVQTSPPVRKQENVFMPAYRRELHRGDRMIVERDVEARIERVKPNGCLIKVKGGFFDLDGFWCFRREGNYVVERNAPPKMMKLLNADQKKELNRVRLNARRNGSR